MKKKTILLIFCVLLSFLALLGCPEGSPIDSSDPELTIEDVLSEAKSALESKDYETALEKYSLAFSMDLNNAEAFMGYNALSLMSLTVDEALVSLLRDNIGIIGYPSTMKDLVAETWLTPIIGTDDDGNEKTILIPNISGQTDGNNDGVIDMKERLEALTTYFLGHNPLGLSDILNTVYDRLDEKLTTHAALLVNAPEDYSITFSSDLFYDSDAELADSSWPKNTDGTPVDVTIGKGELLLAAAQMEMVQSLVKFLSIYDMNLFEEGNGTLEDFYNALMVDGTDPGSPFQDNLLAPVEGAADILAEAKTTFLSALSHFQAALDSIFTADRTGFFLSSDEPWDEHDGMWADLCTMGQFYSLVAEKVEASLEGSETLFLPRAAYEDDANDDGWVDEADLAIQKGYLDGTTAWPTASAPGVVGIPLYYYFENPVALRILDLEEGEPLFFRLNGETMDPLTDHTAVPPGEAFFVRLDPDLFVAAFLENLPQDDPSTWYEIEDVWFDATDGNLGDVNLNSIVDHGDAILIDYDTVIEGLIPLADFADMDSTGYNALEYYGEDAIKADLTVGDLSTYRLFDPAVTDGDLTTIITTMDCMGEPLLGSLVYDDAGFVYIYGISYTMVTESLSGTNSFWFNLSNM